MNYFRKKARLDRNGTVKAADVLLHDHLVNLGGHRFNVAAEEHSTLLFYENGQLQGPTFMTVETFCTKINASCVWWKTPAPLDEKLALIRDIQINLIPNLFLQFRQTDVFIFPMHEGHCLLIPERKVSNINKLTKPFKVDIWIFLLILGILCASLSCYLQRFFPRSLIEIIIFGPPIAEHEMRFIERTTFCALSVLMFILCETYIAKMLAFMISMKYQPYFETVADFVESDIPTLMRNTSVEYWMRYRPELLETAALGDEKLPFDDTRYLDYTRTLGCLRAKTVVGGIENFDFVRNQYRYYVLKEQLLTGFRVHSFSKHDPFSRKFREIYDKLWESGLWKFWHDSSLTLYKRKIDFEYNFLKFEDVIPLWLILAYGLINSTIVFVAELVVHWNFYGGLRLCWHNVCNKIGKCFTKAQ
ncbi:hypothetical protein RP20_CCG006094 [Aedes albopictus]|nr:hypothetical protein RP20_CCG006094 [Aedes albopictus]